MLWYLAFAIELRNEPSRCLVPRYADVIYEQLRKGILPGSARTTEAVRQTIQHSQESLNVLAKRYGINPKTVSKWCKRDFVHDAPMGLRSLCLHGFEARGRSYVCGFSAAYALVSGRLPLCAAAHDPAFVTLDQAIAVVIFIIKFYFSFNFISLKIEKSTFIWNRF